MIRALPAVALLSACPQAAPPAPVAVETPVYGYRIAATYPHDPEAFTQGLIWRDGHLYESTGQVGRSTIRKVGLEDGRVVQSVSVPRPFFGEGIVDWGPEIVSITWRHGQGFRWDRETLRQTGSFTYPGEGWGLTRSDRHIVMSDGTADLRLLDPATLAEVGRIAVTDQGRPVPMLNELEWVNGEIFANVWGSPRIARIDPASGRVTGWIDLSTLAAQHPGSADVVLNGIAYDAERDRLFVTGKMWPRLYEIDLTPPPGR